MMWVIPSIESLLLGVFPRINEVIRYFSLDAIHLEIVIKYIGFHKDTMDTCEHVQYYSKNPSNYFMQMDANGLSS